MSTGSVPTASQIHQTSGESLMFSFNLRQSGTPGRHTGQRVAAIAGLLSICATAAAAPGIKYTDLASAPTGAFVTVFGTDLIGAVQGAEVISQTATKVVLRWQGTSATIGGIPVPVTTRAGRVREATPSTFGSVVSSIQSGDVIYLRGGTYSGQYGTTTWSSERLVLGSWASNTAFIGYPGETASLQDARMGDGAGKANGVTIANLKMGGEDCVFGDSYWENDESGATNGRVVNIDCHGTYGSQNTMTGLVAFGADGWRVLGNRFSNNAPSAINNNHGVYLNVGADDAEVAWNTFRNMRMGHVIQIHTDGPARVYENIRIHNNEIIGNSNGDVRGIVVSGCTNSSTVDIYNNVLLNVGQDFSGIAVYCGQVQIRHNTLSNIRGPTLLMAWGSGFTVTARNNIFIGGAMQTSVGQLVQSDNVTSGTVGSDGRMATPVMKPNVGISTDHAAQARGSSTAVGAYESGSVSATVPNAPSGLSAT